jgi:signal transduction histidine kinase
MTVQMLRRSGAEGGDEDLDLLLREIARLDHSIEELLFHAGTPRYSFAEADLRIPLREAARSVDPLARHLGVELEVGEPGEEVRARADGDRIRQALTNLALNAVQASPPGGRVGLSLAREGEDAVFRSEDAGPGVPEELRERIFEPFVSGREGGTGLGLAVTRSIARAHGGEVSCDRVDDRTRFTLRLPREGAPCRESS